MAKLTLRPEMNSYHRLPSLLWKSSIKLIVIKYLSFMQDLPLHTIALARQIQAVGAAATFHQASMGTATQLEQAQEVMDSGQGQPLEGCWDTCLAAGTVVTITTTGTTIPVIENALHGDLPHLPVDSSRQTQAALHHQEVPLVHAQLQALVEHRDDEKEL